MIDEVVDKQCKEFNLYMAKLKEHCHDLERQIADVKKVKQSNKDKMVKIDESYQSQVVKEVQAKRLIEDANRKTEETAAKHEVVLELESSLQTQLKEVERDFNKLDQQRADLNETQRAILKRTKIVQLLERKIKADRLQVDALIFDHNLEKEFGDKLDG